MGWRKVYRPYVSHCSTDIHTCKRSLFNDPRYIDNSVLWSLGLVFYLLPCQSPSLPVCLVMRGEEGHYLSIRLVPFRPVITGLSGHLLLSITRHSSSISFHFLSIPCHFLSFPVKFQSLPLTFRHSFPANFPPFDVISCPFPFLTLSINFTPPSEIFASR